MNFTVGTTFQLGNAKDAPIFMVGQMPNGEVAFVRLDKQGIGIIRPATMLAGNVLDILPVQLSVTYPVLVEGQRTDDVGIPFRPAKPPEKPSPY